MESRNEFHRDTWVEVDLDAIQHNIQQIAGQIGLDVAIMAVVKANAYGHGYLPVARTALASGATHLAVAFIDEALFLRKQGITAPIMVLGASRPEDAGIAAANEIQLTVYSKEWVVQAVPHIQNKPLLIHVKCDTGMGRIGLKTADELREIEQEAARHDTIKIEGIYTHFATADETDTRYADEQAERFRKLIDHMKVKPPLIHASNSAAALMRRDSFFSIIRFGISMYGLSPSNEIADKLPARLTPALSFHSTVVHVKKVEPGEKISYGSTYEAAGQEWIGTLPVGYADGWIRKMQGFEVLIDGKRVPIVGRVCMDQCMIRMPENYPVGTKVTLIGRQNGDAILIDEVADHLETINYEVACAIAARVPRIYSKKNKSVFVLNSLN
ncbi:alanine racemase [Jeotgalibacillus sp. S-D1]|uniref:alanine racemase n=1 Tax=Jeotgalibacillus sp. S-D1 TaxID=2552189 RepID=UPI001059A3FA|nr:alanine racemase [Jeotgalibacillus sp. S-D1]TDL30497.1 alanine racemase [Jeotgalibacillus sp. S-D1]